MIPRTATEIRQSIVKNEVSTAEVLSETIRRIRAVDPALNAFITLDEEHAWQQVELLEERFARGEAPGPLWGVPFSVKDTYDTAGVRTTYGSRVYDTNIPGEDAEFVRRIRAAGGILIGKTNTPEFAIYIRTTNDLGPETVNPWDLTRTCGGSSGGAAASVASGMTTIAVGGDGGGSIRIPAALCGSVGLLPSRGAVPRAGGSVGTRRFSSAGPHALTAKDASLLFNVMKGPSAGDALSRGLQPTGIRHSPHNGLVPSRIRWIGESGVIGAETDVVDTVHAAAIGLAATLKCSLDDSDRTLDSPRFSEEFYDIMQADRFSTGGSDLVNDPQAELLLTDYARHQFERGASISGASYSRAIDTQLEALVHLEGLISGVDVLAMPTLGHVAPVIPQGNLELPETARRSFVAFTFLMNFTGFPAVTVPCGLVRGMPVGLQLVGRPGSEQLLLEMAAIFQQDVYAIGAAPMKNLFAPQKGA